jgi:YggT family protein
MPLTHSLIEIAHYLLSILTWVIIIQVVLSWLLAFNVLNTSSHGVRTFAVALDRITGPLYRPVRRLLPDFGGIDFSPLVILILIQVLQKLLSGVDAQLSYGVG